MNDSAPFPRSSRPPAALSPELALLAACGLASDEALRARLAEAVGSALDWARFEFLARAHDMAALVAERVGQAAATGPAAEVARALAPALQSGMALHLSQAAETVGVTRCLDAAGVGSIVLKGAALGQMLYAPRPHWRSSIDIDVLVAEADAERGAAALVAAGYRRQWPERPWPAAGRDMLLLLANVLEFTVPLTGQLIELHVRPTRNPAWMPQRFDELQARSVSLELAGGAIRGLDGAELVSYLCWHAFAHFGYRLKWFCDIVRALRRSGAGSCRALCAADARCAMAPLALADEVCGLLAPDSTVVRTAPGRLARRVLRDLEHPTDFPSSRSLALLPAELALRAFLLRISPGWRGKAHELLLSLSDPRDVAVLGLGKRFAPLYALAGPVLALWRFARRPESP